MKAIVLFLGLVLCLFQPATTAAQESPASTPMGISPAVAAFREWNKDPLIPVGAAICLQLKNSKALYSYDESDFTLENVLTRVPAGAVIGLNVDETGWPVVTVYTGNSSYRLQTMVFNGGWRLESNWVSCEPYISQ